MQKTQVPFSAYRVKVQQDMGTFRLKVTHVAVREGGQLWGMGAGHREVLWGMTGLEQDSRGKQGSK